MQNRTREAYETVSRTPSDHFDIRGLDAFQGEGLREALAHRTVQVAAALAVPILGIGVVHMVQSGFVTAAFLGVVALGLLLAAGLAPDSTRRRGWMALGGLLISGTVDLVVRGWQGSTLLLLLTAMVVAALTGGASLGLASVAVISLVLLSSIPLIHIGSWLPLMAEISQPSAVAMVIEAVLLAVLGAACALILRYLLTRSEAGIQQERRRVSLLQAAKTEREQRIGMLQQANAGVQRRANYLEASLLVAHLLSTVFELSALLNRAAELTAEQFNLYHVGVFLMDDTGRWAVLTAASSTAGKALVLRRYQLSRGGHNVVGWVADHRHPQIALRSREDGIPLANDEFPLTRAEMAFPLVAHGRLVGVLDLHSRNDDAFEPDDLRTLKGLARHLAFAVENARRLSDEAAVLEAASPFYRTANALATARTETDVYRVMVETLREYDPARILVVRVGRTGADLAVVADLEGDTLSFTAREVAQLTPPALIDAILMGLALDAPLWVENLSRIDSTLSPELVGALEGLLESSDVVSLAFVPIRMEGPATVGGVLIPYTTVHHFTPMEQRLHRLLTELGGAALERSQLLTQAQDRWERERLLSDIGDTLRASFDPDVIVQTTVRELGKLFDVQQISPPDVTTAAVDQTALVISIGDEEDRTGVIQIGISSDRELTRDEVTFAQAIAEEASHALERARLFTRTQEALLEVDTLYRGSRAMVEATTVDEVLLALTDHLVSPQLDRCLLMMVGTDPAFKRREARVAAVWDPTARGADLVERRWPIHPLLVLAESEDLLTLPDVAISEIDDASRQFLLNELGLTSVLVLPLTAAQQVGWLLIGSTSGPYTFTEREMRLYQGLVDQAATVLRNFQLLDLATEQAERERLVSAIGARVRSSTDIRTILRASVQELGRSLKASEGEIRLHLSGPNGHGNGVERSNHE